MFKKLLLTGALLAAFANISAHAQSSQPFGVTGSIAPPPPTVTIANSGRSDYGSLSATAVKGYTSSTGINDLYSFPAVALAYSITFSAPTKAALSFTDNHAGKVLPFDSFDSIRFGVVDTGATTIGSVAVSLTNTLIDGSPVSVFLSSPTGTTSWSANTVGGKTGIATNNVGPNYTKAFSKTAGATVPDSFTTLSGNLSMVLSLKKSLIDTATTSTTATGSGTFTVVYL